MASNTLTQPAAQLPTPNGATPSPAWQVLVDSRHAQAHQTNIMRRDELHLAGQDTFKADAPTTLATGQKFASVVRPPDTQSY